MTTEFSKAEALQKWRERQGYRPKIQANRIELVNKKMIKDDNGKGKENPDFGKLFAVSFNDNDEEIREEIDIEEARFLPLRWRWHSHKKTDMKDATFYLKEVDEFRPMQVFSKDDHEVIDEGYHGDLKSKYDLTMKTVAYVLYAGKIYRWVMPSSSWRSLQEVRESIGKQEEPYTFKVNSVEETSDDTGTVFYNLLEFGLGEAFDFSEAWDWIQQLDSLLGAPSKTETKRIATTNPKAVPEKIETKNIEDLPAPESVNPEDDLPF